MIDFEGVVSVSVEIDRQGLKSYIPLIYKVYNPICNHMIDSSDPAIKLWIPLVMYGVRI